MGKKKVHIVYQYLFITVTEYVILAETYAAVGLYIFFLDGYYLD